MNKKHTHYFYVLCPAFNGGDDFSIHPEFIDCPFCLAEMKNGMDERKESLDFVIVVWCGALFVMVFIMIYMFLIRFPIR